MSEEGDETAFKPPVHVNSEVRRSQRGHYEVGVSFDRAPWLWSKLTARRLDKAREQSGEAVAHLMVNHAKALEEQAQDLLTKARFLRDCARFKGVI